MLKILLGCLFALIVDQALAASVMVVGVQMPAWVERDGRQIPLKVGTPLVRTDQLRTGANARILLSLEDGSKIKLGENGSLRLDELSPEKDFFTAAFNVVQGAFRFTTDLVFKDKRRDVKVQIGTATIGIRGTDVWGKATEEKDIVCLLEGKISVNRGTDQTVSMQDPLTFYIAPKNQPAQALAPVKPEQIALWAKETDIQPGEGAAHLGGKWKVYLATSQNQDDILKIYDALGSAGYATEINPVTANAMTEYRLRIINLPSKREAHALAKRLLGQAGVDKPWVAVR